MILHLSFSLVQCFLSQRNREFLKTPGFFHVSGTIGQHTQYAPFPRKTAGIVSANIFKSVQILLSSIY